LATLNNNLNITGDVNFTGDLYKNGMVVGGIGVVIRSNPTYTLDLNPTDIDYDLKEIIAQSATSGFTPQTCIRANQITANGVTLRYSDSDDNLKTPSLTTLVSATASYGRTFGAWGRFCF